MACITEQIVLPCGCKIGLYGIEHGKHLYGFTPCTRCRAAAKIHRLIDAANTAIGFLHHIAERQAEPDLEETITVRTELEVALEGLGEELKYTPLQFLA